MDGEHFGWMGKMLVVDLSARSARVVPLGMDLLASYLGGKGLGARLLYDELPARCDPLGPENMLIFANGPLTGTLAPAASRCVVCTKSPLTGAWLDTNAGGFFGPELKAAGYDALMIKGKAPEPTCLVIDDEKVEFHDAVHLWGQGVFATHGLLRDTHGEDFIIACIGPAGEQQVRLASIISEARAFGRGGAGAVMGSKNLKAIAVRGSKDIAIYDQAGFLTAIQEAINELNIHPDTGGGRPKYGTNVIYSLMNVAGVHPVHNFQEGVFVGVGKMNEEVWARDYYTKHKACFACPISCSKISRVREGRYGGKYTEGPDYENTWSFGAQCGNQEPGAVVYAEYLCDEYGLDAISVGNCIGFAMECFEKGLLSKSEVGFSLRFGDDEAIIRLVHLIGQRAGIGALLGEGVKRVAAKLGGGSEAFSMHVKGLELPAYDPRGCFGIGLAYATSDRGGCHLRSWPVASEILRYTDRMDPLSTEFKAEFVKNEQDLIATIDSLGICLFVTFALSPRQLVSLTYALTGSPEVSSGDKLVTIGERIYNLTRLFNLREGFTYKDDTLPPRLLSEALSAGPAKGQVVPLDTMVREYYLVRQWDAEGCPTPEKLASLGLRGDPA